MHAPRWTTAFLLAACLPACTGYQTVAEPSNGLLISPTQLDEARVTLRSGERLKLSGPQIYGDSLRGTMGDGRTRRFALADLVVCTVVAVISPDGTCESGEKGVE